MPLCEPALTDQRLIVLSLFLFLTVTLMQLLFLIVDGFIFSSREKISCLILATTERNCIEEETAKCCVIQLGCLLVIFSFLPFFKLCMLKAIGFCCFNLSMSCLSPSLLLSLSLSLLHPSSNCSTGSLPDG